MKHKHNFHYYLLVFFLFLGSASVHSQSWNKMVTNGSLPARSNSSAIYDSIHHRLVMFGGLSSAGPTNTVYCLDLNTSKWTLMETKSAQIPDPRFSHNAMYDAQNNRMLIWSGQGTLLYNDVWALNFKDSTWSNLSSNGNTSGKPLQRYGTAAIYNYKNHQLINFAGFTTEGRFGDTWSFDTEALTWKDNTTQVGPLKRCLHSSAYSTVENRMYIFGGQSTGNLNDLWSLDLPTLQWEALPTNQVPSARHFTSLISTGDRLLLFGGNTSSQGNYSGGTDDLWQFKYSNQQWEKVMQTLVEPGARSGHIAVYDSKSKSMMLAGGHNTDGRIYDDVWTYGPLVDETTGVTEGTIHKNSIKVFPNPFQEVVNIDVSLVPGAEQVSVYNSQGLLVLTIKIAQENTLIPIPGAEQLAPGVYHLLVHRKTSAYSVEVVKY